MLEALLGGLFGGLFRLAPEILKLWNGVADRRHEKEMFALQIERDKVASSLKIQEIGAQAQGALDMTSMEAFIEAVRSQGRLTGVKFVDAVSQTVRPFLTYWWMSLYTAFKAAVLWQMWRTQESWVDAVTWTWTAADMGVLSGIINFWFLDRVLRSRQ